MGNEDSHVKSLTGDSLNNNIFKGIRVQEKVDL